MYRYYNPNPRNTKNIGDCTVRAVSKALGVSWNTAYFDLAVQGYLLADMPSSNMVMNAYLHANGFKRYVIDNTCPNCYTIRQFTEDHPYGTYILGTGNHVVAVIDGCYYDAFDSGDEAPLFYYHYEG